MLAMGEHGGDRRFTWFRPLECNTLRPRENENCIVVCCSSTGLALGCLESGLRILKFVAAFYSTRLQRLHCVLGPDRWLQAG
jgi:hypothetical protein